MIIKQQTEKYYSLSRSFAIIQFRLGRTNTIVQLQGLITSDCFLTASKSYPCPYFDPMVPMDDQTPIWSIISNGHPEGLRLSLKVCRKLWAVNPMSFFNYFPSAFSEDQLCYCKRCARTKIDIVDILITNKNILLHLIQHLITHLN